MRAIIEVDVPDHQIGQEVSIYFKDTMMIKGIVQEPSDDSISRQAVLDRKYVVEVKNMWHMTEEIEVVNVDDIKALPSVNPQEPKTGHWIIYNYPGHECVYCSSCKEEYYEDDLYMGGSDFPNYCPNCGARMESEG